MTVRFNCPNCDELIAFADKYIGKQARCTSCGQRFIIPSEDKGTPKKVEPPVEKAEPVPGFYRAVFVDNWKLFFDSENVTSLVFVIAVVCFKFFSARACCCAYITYYVVWGWLLGFYLNIIYEAVFDIDKLPEIYLGTSITFIWYVIKPFLVFFCTMATVQLPFIITLVLLKDKGLTYENMWQAEIGLRLLLQVLFILGLFLFPIAILTAAVGKDITMFSPDYLLVPISKAFTPYIVVVALLIAAAALETRTIQYTGATFLTTACHLALNLGVQAIAIIAMRSIGLFYRHYSCYFPW